MTTIMGLIVMVLCLAYLLTRHLSRTWHLIMNLLIVLAFSVSIFTDNALWMKIADVFFVAYWSWQTRVDWERTVATSKTNKSV
jgi:uncharacterized membrane protein